jgi:hypothetical protein
MSKKFVGFRNKKGKSSYWVNSWFFFEEDMPTFYPYETKAEKETAHLAGKRLGNNEDCGDIEMVVFEITETKPFISAQDAKKIRADSHDFYEAQKKHRAELERHTKKKRGKALTTSNTELDNPTTVDVVVPKDQEIASVSKAPKVPRVAPAKPEKPVKVVKSPNVEKTTKSKTNQLKNLIQ